MKFASLIIAAGILRKNYKFVQQYEKTETRVRELVERMNRAREQLEALKADAGQTQHTLQAHLVRYIFQRFSCENYRGRDFK